MAVNPVSNLDLSLSPGAAQIQIHDSIVWSRGEQLTLRSAVNESNEPG